MSRASRRMAVLTPLLIALAAWRPCAAQTADTARFTASDLEDLVEGLKATTGIDYGTFMSRYVDGTKALPVREYVNLGDAALATYRRAALQDLAERGQPAPAQPPALEPALAATLELRR